MSTTLDQQRERTQEAADPFRYGWRYVKRTLPDGKETFVQVPLTLEDVLHPQEEDFIVNSHWHHQTLKYLDDALEAWLKDRPGTLVLSDHRILWSDPEVAYGPDIAVIFGVPSWNPRRGTFPVGEMGVAPSLVIEVVSPTTRNNDVVEKYSGYHEVRVPTYVIVDNPEEDDQPPVSLVGYRYEPQSYVRMEPDDKGRLWLEAVNLFIELDGETVHFSDAQGQRIGTYLDVQARAAAAEAQVQQLQTQLKLLQDKLSGGTTNGAGQPAGDSNKA